MRLLGAFILVLVLAAALAAPGCSHKASAPLDVVVTIAPLKGLVDPLLPPGASAHVLIRPGRSEHGYEFTPADTATMAKADVLVYVGLRLEGRLESTIEKQNAPRRQVVCFAQAAGITAQAGEPSVDPAKEHDQEHEEHAPGYIDPHLWLDPVLVQKFIPAVKDAIAAAEKARGELSPAESQRLDAAAAALAAKVEGVDREWRESLAPYKGRSIITHHNDLSRPAERYGFKVAAVIREFETAEPSPGDIANVVEAIRREHVGTIFVEPQFNAAAAQRIAAQAGVKVGRLDPLGDGDWFAMMKSNLAALVEGFSQSTPNTGGK